MAARVGDRGPKYLSDAGMAMILCGSGELQSRSSEYKALADARYLQLYSSLSMVRSKTGNRDEAGTEAVADLKPEELTEVKG